MALTDMFVRQAKATGKDYTIPDFDGLSLAVSDKGAKSWHFRYTWLGRQKRMSLGTYPEISLREARERRDNARALVAKGINPQRQRKKDRRIATQAEQNTFEAVYDKWLVFRAQGRLKKGRQTTLSMIPRIFTNDILPSLRKRSIYEITRADLLEIVGRIEKRGAPSIAEKVRTWFNQLFRYALVIVPGLEQNPASDLDVVAMPQPPVRHNPFLRMPELPAFLKFLRKYPGKLKTQLGLRLLLLTGVRTGELRLATPDQFHLDDGLWIIPPEVVKQLELKMQKENIRPEDIPPYIVPLPEPDLPALSQTLIAQLLIAFIAVISVVMMAARLATKPLDQLARAADTLGHNLDAPPLSEEGLVETRLAAQAFNRMQARIKYLVNERTQALVAISHDLRTPLTRLRLRIEFVDDDQLRDQLAADLDAMSALIDQALEYLRELRDSEEMCPVDMNGLLQSLAENAALLGRPINIVGMAFTPYTGRLSALRRALLNLIDNAVRYGHGAHVRVEDGPAMLRLIVENNGPGMPSVEPSSIFTRCSRPGVLRSVDAGGAGLACSIAKDIALMHDGDLLIINHLEYGFSAVLELPRTPNVASKSLDQFSP